MSRATRLAPIALFVYGRPLHTQRTLDALAANDWANESDLIVYADGPRDATDVDNVQEVRKIIGRAKGFANVRLVGRDRNLGLAENIISGVTEICARYGRAIVLEDDIVTGPGFLAYMNAAIKMYQDADEVASISGYSFPTENTLPPTFFSRLSTSWGWATWRRAWSRFEADGAMLLHQLKSARKTYAFDHDGSYPFTKMLEDWCAGRNSSWAIRWYASNFLEDKLTLFPGQPLVENIGYDGTGTHCGNNSDFKTRVKEWRGPLKRVAVQELQVGRQEIRRFFMASSRVSVRWRLRSQLRQLVP